MVSWLRIRLFSWLLSRSERVVLLQVVLMAVVEEVAAACSATPYALA